MTEVASEGSNAPLADRHAAFSKGKLFILSVTALVTAGLAFSVRTSVADDVRKEFFDPINPLHSGDMIGAILGNAFLGFAITIFIGSPLLDYLGMGALLGLSSLTFIFGTLISVFAATINHSTGIPVYWVLMVGMVLTGVGWGLVETVINPLTATLYPKDKTHKLNVLHAWWPGGIIIGGIIGLLLGQLHMNWQAKMLVILIPAISFGVMLIGSKFPPSERVAAGVSAKDMWGEILKRPFFLVWFFSMFLTAASELAPGQWVDMALTRTVGIKGIWLLIYVSGMMFVMRHFAGTMVHKLSPVGLLWTSCLLASCGLLSLSVANSPVTGLLAATVWGVGVCYMWPTMLAASSERFPRGGALLMGLMGTAGTLSIRFVLPLMGQIFDYFKVQFAGGPEAFSALAEGSDRFNAALSYGAQMSFRIVAILPAVLLLVFGAIWLYDRSHGGYKPEHITAAEELGEPVISEL